MAYKIKPITEQLILPIQDIKLIPSGVLYINTDFNKNFLKDSSENELISELASYKIPRYVYIGTDHSGVDKVTFTMNSNKIDDSNNILNPLETSLPGIINSDDSDKLTVSLFLYKYSDVPLRDNSEKPSIFKYISNMDYYPIDAINFSESYRKFISSYQNAEINTEPLNNTSTFKTSINQYVENSPEYSSDHKSLYVLGSAPYMYRAFRFLKESYEKKKAIIERYFPIFDPNYNYDTSASKPEKEVFVDDNGFLVDKPENGKRIKLSAFQMFNVPNSVEVYLGIKEIEIPFQTTELTNSENSDANRIIMAKFPRYLLDDDIEHYNAIKYIRIVNYTAGSTKFYYSKQSLVNDNDEQPLTAKYGSQLAELNIFEQTY